MKTWRKKTHKPTDRSVVQWKTKKEASDKNKHSAKDSEMRYESEKKRYGLTECLNNSQSPILGFQRPNFIINKHRSKIIATITKGIFIITAKKVLINSIISVFITIQR